MNIHEEMYSLCRVTICIFVSFTRCAVGWAVICDIS